MPNDRPTNFTFVDNSITLRPGDFSTKFTVRIFINSESIIFLRRPPYAITFNGRLHYVWFVDYSINDFDFLCRFIHRLGTVYKICTNMVKNSVFSFNSASSNNAIKIKPYYLIRWFFFFLLIFYFVEALMFNEKIILVNPLVSFYRRACTIYFIRIVELIYIKHQRVSPFLNFFTD